MDFVPRREWLPVLLSPALRRLESLSLRALFVVDADEWAAAFHNLPALHSLHLRQFSCIDSLLAAMATNPSAFRSLRCLRIAPEQLENPRELMFRLRVPSYSALHRLLTARPDLAVLELELPPQPASSARVAGSSTAPVAAAALAFC